MVSEWINLTIISTYCSYIFMVEWVAEKKNTVHAKFWCLLKNKEKKNHRNMIQTLMSKHKLTGKWMLKITSAWVF